MKTLQKQKIKTAINIQTGDDGTQAKKILEILELLEKMKDFFYLSKERFLESYSYLTEEEYNLTLKKVNDLATS